MTSPPTIPTKFLPAKDQLGLVAVGFSGGQVCLEYVTLYVLAAFLMPPGLPFYLEEVCQFGTLGPH